EEQKFLGELTIQEYKQINNVFESDIYDALNPKTVMEARISEGGTSSKEVLNQLFIAEESLKSS
ncbi:argininosuccinate lyase, partial [Bacillus sp. JJ664]